MSSSRHVPPTRVLSLDILRLVACVLVIGNHLEFPNNAPSFFHAIASRGWVGVDAFFVLSGFLVAGILFREYAAHGQINLRRFLIRRGLKIYPAFYCFLLLTACTIAVMARDRCMISPARLLSESLFVQNYFPGTWGHTWSLAVEEHFYIGIALILLVFTSLGINLRGAGPPIFLGCVAVVTLSLRLRVCDQPFSEALHWWPTHLRIDSLGCGVFLAYWWHLHPRKMQVAARLGRPVWILVGAVLLLPLAFYPRESDWFRTYGLSVLSLGNGALLLGMIVHPFPSNLITRTLAAIGAQSYSIYLWHAPVVTWIMPRIQDQLTSIHPLLAPFVGLTLSLGLGMFMAAVLEVPLLRLRDHWIPPTSLSETLHAAA